jgi:hypothetical protein
LDAVCVEADVVDLDSESDISIVGSMMKVKGEELLLVMPLATCMLCKMVVLADELLLVQGDEVKHDVKCPTPWSSATTHSQPPSSAAASSKDGKLLDDALAIAMGATAVDPRKGAGVKAVLKRPASHYVQEDKETMDLAKARHDELVKLAKHYNIYELEGDATRSVRYEPKLRKGSWFRCRHTVQARVCLGETKMARGFNFDFGKGESDKIFKQKLEAAVHEALAWCRGSDNIEGEADDDVHEGPKNEVDEQEEGEDEDEERHRSDESASE